MITKVTMARAYDMYRLQLSRRGDLSAPVAGGNRRSQMNRIPFKKIVKHCVFVFIFCGFVKSS
jgi:hypothetical protein